MEGRGLDGGVYPDSRVGDDPRFRDDVPSSPPGEDSPIPPTFSTVDLLQLLEVGQDMRRITRCIKHLCSTEQTLRYRGQGIFCRIKHKKGYSLYLNPS